MIRLTPRDLIDFGTTTFRRETSLYTLYEGKEFKVHMEGDAFRFLPSKHPEKEPRLHDGKYLKSFCDRFNKDNSFEPSNYNRNIADQKGTLSASYILTVVAKYLGAIADGKAGPAKRGRRQTAISTMGK